MILNRKVITLITIGLLLFSGFAVLATNYSVKAQLGQATLTGIIFDKGIDTNDNGKYDYLEVTVEINVTTAGDFRVEINQFIGENGSSLYFYGYNYSHLDTGLGNLTILFYGPTFYHASFNPKNISQISLILDYQYPPIETIYDVPLSRAYNYTEFGIGAFFTKTISDSGIDTDGDGLFDILQIGVQINVTDPGEYSIDIYALVDNSVPYQHYYDEPQSVQENFSAAIYMLLFNFSGPGIASQHVNVTTIQTVYLSALSAPFIYISTLDQLSNVPLSMTYNYTMFDAPSADTELNFTVYPDGSIGVGMLANATRMYPPNNFLLTNSTLSISRNQNLTTGAANGVFSSPSNAGALFDSSETYMQTIYQDGILNQTIGETVFLPPEAQTTYPFNSTDLTFNAAYANGIVDAHLSGDTVVPMFDSMFPFNASDLTVFADYDGAMLMGNVTFHIVSGFPLADIRSDFQGNRTNVQFTGNVNVTYGTYGELLLNSTILDALIANLTSQITGQGPSSLYNMTSGTLEVTELNITKTPWANPGLGADITYAVTVNGNFTLFLSEMILDQTLSPGYTPEEVERLHHLAYTTLESTFNSVNEAHLILNYYHNTGIGSIVTLDMAFDAKTFWNNILALVPPNLPVPGLPLESASQLTALLEIYNATAYAVQDFSMSGFLSSSELKIGMTTSILANETQLKADILPFMPDLAPPQLHDTFESFFNSSHAVLESETARFDMINGTGSFSVNWTVQGDMSTDLNRGIHLYFDMINATSPGAILSPELLLLNETDIDVDNLQVQVNLGKDTLFINMTGLILRPRIDQEDFIRFRLYHWFDALRGVYASLQGNQRLKVDVTGGFDSTHIILLNPSSLVSGPDSYSLNYTSMAWQNTTFSNMGNLEFQIAYDGKINYTGTTYHIPIFTNSTVSNVTFLNAENTLSFEVSGENGTGFCNVTMPRNFINATLGQWQVKLDGAFLATGDFIVSENAQYVFLYLNYTHSTHTIEIVGTSSVAELQPSLLPFILVAMTLIAAALTIKRKKLTQLKAKCETSLRTFIATHHR